MSVVPRKIKLAAPDQTLSIEWSDGHRSAYPYRFLRDACPCSTCGQSGAAGHADPGPFPILGQKPLRPEHAELVGRYALQVFWSDGHSAGIYGFDYLRQLCPCAECQALHAGPHTQTS